MNYRKLIMAALAASVVVPTATVSAQSRGEVRDSRHDVQRQKQDLRQALRHGDRHDVRDARHDVKQARQEYREDLRDYRDYRARHRTAFRASAYRSNIRYRPVRVGLRINSGFYGSNYAINPLTYRLPRAHANQRWVRYYDDVLLVNVRTGVVVRVIPNFFYR